MTLPEFTESYLAHVIAIIALTQVWVIAGYKKWIQKGRIEFYPTGRIEIGFSSFGCTLSLPGTFKAAEKEVFVSQMTAKATRKSDNAQHTFTCRAYKSISLSSETLAPQKIDIASPFTALVNVPWSQNIFFGSENFSDRYGQEAGQLKAEWASFGMQKSREIPRFQERVQDQIFINDLFEEFLGNGTPLKLYTKLNNEFFWQPGQYEIELKIECADGDGAEHHWAFEISDDDEKNLRNNAIPILKDICAVPTQYNFVYKSYAAP